VAFGGFWLIGRVWATSAASSDWNAPLSIASTAQGRSRGSWFSLLLRLYAQAD